MAGDAWAIALNELSEPKEPANSMAPSGAHNFRGENGLTVSNGVVKPICVPSASWMSVAMPPMVRISSSVPAGR